MQTALALIAAYLLGSVPFAMISSKVFGLADPRTYGSGNPGATNVLRSGNKKAALTTLIGDALKGTLAVLIAQQMGLSATVVALVALAVFIGHLYPIFLKFKGGKGVATALGVLLGISGWLGLLVLLTWLTVAFTTRYSSLSALLAAVLAPVYYLLLGDSLWAYDKWVMVAVVAMSALLLWRHADNISRLLKGQESKIGSKKDKSPAAPAAAAKGKKPR